MASVIIIMEGLEAALNASMDRQTSSRSNLTSKQQALVLGDNLKRLMVGLTTDIEALRGEVDEGECSTQQCVSSINTLYDTKLALLRTYAEWERVNGPGAESSVGRTVANLELMSNKLIDDFKARMDELNSLIARSRSPVIRPPQTEIVVSGERLNSSKTLENVSKTPDKSNKALKKSKVIEPTSVDPVFEEISKFQKSTEKTRDTTPAPVEVVSVKNSQAQKKFENPADENPNAVTSSYGERLASIKPGKTISKKGSRASRASKADSKASNAAKLQVRLEEAEAKIEEDYNKELSERSRRVAARNAKKQQEAINTKLADEEAEREAKLKRKRASIKAKKDIIDAFEVENSIKSVSEPEITPMSKAAAFIARLFDQDRGGGVRTRKTA